MGRFTIDTDGVHQEADTHVEAWQEALRLHAAGHKRVEVRDTTIVAKSASAASLVEKKGKKK